MRPVLLAGLTISLVSATRILLKDTYLHSALLNGPYLAEIVLLSIKRRISDRSSLDDASFGLKNQVCAPPSLQRIIVEKACYKGKLIYKKRKNSKWRYEHNDEVVDVDSEIAKKQMQANLPTGRIVYISIKHPATKKSS